MLARYSLSIFNKVKNDNKCNHSKKYYKKMNKINNMFYNLNKKNNLSIMDLDSYFCEKEICTL